MLFFIDETWQKVGAQDVGALAAVAIPRSRYNAFCREIWKIKETLGANELDECELKGNNLFAKSAFRKREYDGHSKLLHAAEETIAAVSKYNGSLFGVWTTDEQWMLLRNPDRSELSPPYHELMWDLRRCLEVRANGKGRQGMLFLDHRGRKEDSAAGAALQNFIARMRKPAPWSDMFMQTPHFTPSVISPGIQAADVVAYLTAHQIDRSVRPELHPYWEMVENGAFVWNGRSAFREVPKHAGKKKGPAGT